MFRRTMIRALFLLSAASLLLTGCPPKPGGGPLIEDAATIVFDQVGACNGYQQTSGPPGSGPVNVVSAGANQAYVVFRVVEIDNTKSSKDFNFDPARLYVSGSNPRAYVKPTLSFAQDLGVFTAVPMLIPKGKKVGINGLAVAVVPTGAVNGASEANSISYMLLYDPAPGDPGIFPGKRNHSQTSWPQTDDCRAIQY